VFVEEVENSFLLPEIARSLGYITPNEFAQDEVGEEAQAPCRALGRAMPSLRPSIHLLYDIEQITNPSRVTNALDQFG
jgi:hypothetical protein